MGRAGEAITLLTAEDEVAWRKLLRELPRHPVRRPWKGGHTATVAATVARIQPPPAFRSNHHEAGVFQDAKLSLDTGLADVDEVDQLANRPLTFAQRFDQAPARRVGQDLKDVGHGRYIIRATYFVSTICRGGPSVRLYL